MAHVHGKPRCDRCKEFRPTQSTRVSRGVMQLCARCQLLVGYTDAAVPSPREAGPRVATRPAGKTDRKVVAPPRGFTLPEPPNA